MATIGDHDLLVAYDDTDAGRRAAEFAAERAAQTGESVTVIHIGSDLSEAEMRDAIGEPFASHGVPVSFRMFDVGGSEDENISIRAKLGEIIDQHEYTMIVMGNEKHSLFHGLTEGSISGAVIDDQVVPVLLVP
jgi:nucleotide-binding universal stress UspA family protein